MSNQYGRRPSRVVHSVAGDPKAFNGVWDGVVVDVKDPEQVGRVRVRVYDLHDEDTPVDQLPWAYPCFMGAFSTLQDDSVNGGLFQVPPVDSLVLVMFRKGDPEWPVWMGGWHPKQPAITGREGYSDHTRRKALYNPDGIPSCPTWASAGGSRIEMDDEAGEIRVTTPGGQKLTLSDKASNEHSQGIKLEDSSGNYLWIDTAAGIMSLRFDGDMVVDVTGDYNLNVGGTIKVKTGADLNVGVGGSENRSVTATAGVSAALLNLNPTAPVQAADPDTADQGTSTSGNPGILEKIGNQLRKQETGD